jgi:hypothetical protein
VKILGLYAPREHKILTEDVLDQEIQRLSQELRLMGVEDDELSSDDELALDAG